MVKKILIVSSVVIAFLALGISLLNTIKEREVLNETFPEFILPDINGNIINSLDIEKKPSLLLFFNSECDLCMDELRQINEDLDSFKDFQIFFITNEPSNILSNFLDEIHFVPIQNTHFLIDQKHELILKMNVNIIPSSFVYNKNKILTKKTEGL